MTQKSIEAYDLAQRVQSYDADMELMHPNRAKMVDVALQVLPFATDMPIRAVDLGVGTGYLTQRFLDRFPNATVTAIDGARAMIDLAQIRLGESAARVKFAAGDFRELRRLAGNARNFDAAFSAYALHHLNASDKKSVLKQVVDLLRPEGWFINADIIKANSLEIERRVQQLRVAGIVKRAGGRDKRFADAMSTRKFLDDLQANEADQPLTLAEDLAILRDAGFKTAAAFWLEYRELVSGGQK